MSTATFTPGLEGVVAAETRLSLVDGQHGRLVIAGYPLERLAGIFSFEEVAYLLWHDRLPDPDELADFRRLLAVRRAIPAATLDLLRAAAPERVPVMDALRMAAATLSLGHAESAREDALTLLASFPTIVGSYWRLLGGQDPLPTREDLGHSSYTLYQLFGEVPSAERAKGLDTYLATVAEHGLNASTFTARVIISTQSDMISAITGAIGALKGPLHGGAPGPALDMVFEIGTADRAEAVLREKLGRGDRIMGFGHRVYKVRDPRADVLAAAAERLFSQDADRELYTLVQCVEQTATRVLAEIKPGRKLETNVEFYTALLLHGLDLPVDLFSPMFAIGRVAGWTAHCFEQIGVGRLIRPESRYVGKAEGGRWKAE